MYYSNIIQDRFEMYARTTSPPTLSNALLQQCMAYVSTLHLHTLASHQPDKSFCVTKSTHAATRVPGYILQQFQ